MCWLDEYSSEVSNDENEKGEKQIKNLCFHSQNKVNYKCFGSLRTDYMRHFISLTAKSIIPTIIICIFITGLILPFRTTVTIHCYICIFNC